jgi:hypothetical protein
MESVSLSLRVPVRRPGPLRDADVESRFPYLCEGEVVDFRPLKMPPNERRIGRRRGSDAALISSMIEEDGWFSTYLQKRQD